VGLLASRHARVNKPGQLAASNSVTCSTMKPRVAFGEPPERVQQGVGDLERDHAEHLRVR
jgi:hypothetical protein